jgi:hypothetical protein
MREGVLPLEKAKKPLDNGFLMQYFRRGLREREIHRGANINGFQGGQGNFDPSVPSDPMILNSRPKGSGSTGLGPEA